MSRKKAVLLGLFDGLHRGHMSAVGELLKQSGEKTVFTFDSATMTTKGRRGLLMSDGEKRERLCTLGVDKVVSKDFSEYKDIAPDVFVREVLIGRLEAETVICGENFRFGRGGTADAAQLFDLCKSAGAKAIIVPTVFDGGEPISTSRIRALIEEGKIGEANRLLGYPYSFSGEIIHGDRIGTSIGIKTVNIGFDPERALPKKGVYAARAEIDGKVYSGVTNVGTRPTVHEDGKIVIETHLIDFDGDVYGKRATVSLLEFLREERRFGSLEELRQTVANDINTVKETVRL